MRSASLAGLYERSGMTASAMTGGYKAYRNHLHEYLKNEFRFLVMGGMTGSGKTDMLRELGRSGYDIIDLEQLASHKGSVFGAIGESPQPTTEYFENLLFDKMVIPDWQKPVFIEDESLSIGSVFLPKPFHSNMLACPLLNIIVPEKERIKRLVDMYAGADKELLTHALLKIEKRLGVENTRKAVSLVHSGNFGEAVALVLGYYDKVYLRTMRIQHATGKILNIYLNHNDIKKNTAQLLEYCTMKKLLS
jgi:tRNA 2-selenouridine synthase